MAYNSFPYSNFHELNLDYLLNKSKEIEGNVQETADNVLRATQQADRSTQQAVNSQNSATASAQSAAASSQSAVNSANSAAASAQSAEEARAAAGDPKTFTAAAQLTDTTKIYVYVGETGTYTYGHYYYYQAGSWHDGGVYGTWATDDALSDSSTNAVQNRVVNAAVSELKSDFTGYIYGVNETFTHTGSTGWDYFLCLLLEGVEYTVTNNSESMMQMRIYRPDNSRVEIGYAPANGTLKFIVPSDEFVRIGGYMTNGASFTVTADYSNLTAAPKVKDEILKNYCNTNIFEDASFTSGGYVSVATFANTSINEGTARIHTQITLDEPLPYGMLIKILNSGYEYECGLFDENGTSLGYKSGWQANDWSVTAGSKIKYVRLNIRKNDDTVIAAYDDEICGYKDGFASLLDAYNKITEIDTHINSATVEKLAIMSNNCGHFNYGSSSEYSGDDMQAKITEWKAMIARNKPDIILAQECSQYFDAGRTVNAFDTLYKPLLPNMYYGSYTKVISKIQAVRQWQLDLTVTVDEQTESRYLTCCDFIINGKTIGVCSVHLSPGYDTHANNVREAQRDKIITAFGDYDYAIIAGDFNAQADAFYTAFTDVGYSMANHGYFGNINTFPNEPIDNIIVKGFLLYDAVSKAEDKCTSDHQPIISDILMI